MVIYYLLYFKKIILDNGDVIEIARELATNADKFKITLPKSLHDFLNSGQQLQTDKKNFELVLFVIALTIAIDHLYFENKPRYRSN